MNHFANVCQQSLHLHSVEDYDDAHANASHLQQSYYDDQPVGTYHIGNFVSNYDADALVAHQFDENNTFTDRPDATDIEEVTPFVPTHDPPKKQKT